MGAWGVSHDKVKGGLGSGRVRPGIVYILGQWEPFMPCCLAMVNEDAEVLFKPLVCLFGLAIGLWVIGGADVLLDVQELA